MKKLLALVLALVMTLSLCITSNAAYTDAADIDYAEAVEVMSAIGVFDGMDGKFNPDGILTREQAAKIIAYMLLGKTAADSLSTASAPFADVAANRWSAGAIAYCASEGIIAGVGNGNFDPTGELTGYAFAKFCLCALGYKADQEGFTGADWQINVAKLAISSGISDDLEIVMGNKLARQEAAKMAYNTLTATMVEYSNGVNVATTDGTKVTVNATRSFVWHTDANGYKDANNDLFMQFCEQYFSNLKLENGTDGDFDRPAETWAYKNKTVGTYDKTPTLVYTAEMNTKSEKKQVTSDVKGWYWGDTANAGVDSAGNVDTAAIDSAADLAALTKNGRVVEVYVSNNIVTNIVAIDYVLDTVSKVASDKVTMKSTKVVEDDDALWGFFKGLEKKDVVVVAYDGDNAVEAYEPTTVSNVKYTKFQKDSSEVPTYSYTIGGEVYEKAVSYASVAKLATTAANINSKYDLTLDKFGYVIDVDDVTASTSYALVLGVDCSRDHDDYTVEAKLLFADGSAKWVTVSKIGDDKIEDLADPATAIGDLNTDFVSYTEKDGSYELTFKQAADLTKGTITKGVAGGVIFGDDGSDAYVATSKTVFVLKNSDKTYTAYVGIKNVPSMVVGANKANVLHTVDGYADMVVIEKADTTTVSDQIFVYSTTVQGAYTDGTKAVSSYKAIVNGVDGTIDVLDTAWAAAIGLYTDSAYADAGYVATIGTKYIATTADGDSVLVFVGDDARDGKNDGTYDLKDILLKDGVLTVDLNGATDVVKLVNDDFQAFAISGTTVSELELSKTDTFSDDGSYEAAVAANDYAILVLDKDGYADTLYFFDV